MRCHLLLTSIMKRRKKILS
uniref:Uncharacterized protein n=1 Tax=Rhizophora mucronata TaxID=61149 RepID=A0A2P2J4X0_RHIMU